MAINLALRGKGGDLTAAADILQPLGRMGDLFDGGTLVVASDRAGAAPGQFEPLGCREWQRRMDGGPEHKPAERKQHSEKKTWYGVSMARSHDGPLINMDLVIQCIRIEDRHIDQAPGDDEAHTRNQLVVDDGKGSDLAEVICAGAQSSNPRWSASTVAWVRSMTSNYAAMALIWLHRPFGEAAIPVSQALCALSVVRVRFFCRTRSIFCRTCLSYIFDSEPTG